MTEIERKIVSNLRGLHTLAANDMWIAVREGLKETLGLLESSGLVKECNTGDE